MTNLHPRNFVITSDQGRHLVCDPTAPLEPGCDVVYRIDWSDEQRFYEGTLRTKNPQRSKTLCFMDHRGAFRRRAGRHEVFRVVAEVRYLPRS